MKDEVRLSQMKKEYDALKVEHGVVIKEYETLKAELKKSEGVKSLKEAEKLLNSLTNELNELGSKRDEKMEFIESQLQKYRRK